MSATFHHDLIFGLFSGAPTEIVIYSDYSLLIS